METVPDEYWHVETKRQSFRHEHVFADGLETIFGVPLNPYWPLLIRNTDRVLLVWTAVITLSSQGATRCDECAGWQYLLVHPQPWTNQANDPPHRTALIVCCIQYPVE